MRRVAYLEDPAQLDPDKRRRGIDGLRSGGRHHICADLASRITDPDAFATSTATSQSAHPGRPERPRPEPANSVSAAVPESQP
jgi:hypothetical protein